jgi:hypothetical protein
MRDHWNALFKIAWIVTLSASLAASVTAAPAQQGGGGGQRGGQRGGGQAARPMPPTPRYPDGTINLGWADAANKGVWRSTRIRDLGEMLVDRKEEGLPYQPWAKALYDYRVKTEQKDDPEGLCLPPGGSLLTANRTTSPWEFVQIPEQKRILRLFEGGGHMWQVIYMDGRPHPQEAVDLPTWMGHSVGHWEGDTLVVDTVGFNEGQWLSTLGAPRTSQHHLTERFTRVNYNTLRYEATIDDPGAYTRPFTIGWNLTWAPGQDLQEVVCTENNQYPNLYPDEQTLLKQLGR